MAVDRNETSTAKNINATKELSFLESHSPAILPVILIISDYVSVLLAEKTALFFRPFFSFAYNGSFHVPDHYQYILVPVVFLFFLIQARTHNRRQPFWLLTKTIFKSVLYSVFVGVAILFFAHIADKVSRIFFLLLGPIAFVYISSMRYIINKFFAKFNFLQEPVIVVGAGKTAELMINFFERDAGFNLKVAGLIDEKGVSSALEEKYRIYGSFAQTERIIKDTGVKSVVIAAPEMQHDKLLELINSIQPEVRNISFVPDLLGIPAGNFEIVQLFDEKLLLIRTKNNLSYWYNRFYKRIFDIVLSLFSMAFFIPLGILIALCIYIDSPGAVVFSHRRVGQGGKYFPCYKFRTMVPKAEEVLAEYLSKNPEAKKEWESDFKLKVDPRVTRVGKFLRKSSLDELPQIINVLKGEMSLVGPRPIVKDEIEKYGDYIRDYFLVLPGITGMWQVNGRSDTTYAERVAMDTWYVRNWSIWLDLVFLFKTVKIVLSRKGAY